MLIHQGDTRSPLADQHLAWSLASVAGGVNGAGFYAAGFYSSHMTGTVSIMADRLALGNWWGALLSLAVVGCFVLGALVSAILINEGQRRRLPTIYALSILTEAILLAALAAVDFAASDLHRGPLLVFGLSMLMGLQNAVVTRISKARVRTTHVTGMITDIGIELGNLMHAAFFGRRDRHDFGKLKLHAPTVLCFFGGGCLGVLGYRYLASGILMLFAAALLLLAAYGLYRARIETALGEAD